MTHLVTTATLNTYDETDVIRTRLSEMYGGTTTRPMYTRMVSREDGRVRVQVYTAAGFRPKTLTRVEYYTSTDVPVNSRGTVQTLRTRKSDLHVYAKGDPAIAGMSVPEHDVGFTDEGAVTTVYTLLNSTDEYTVGLKEVTQPTKVTRHLEYMYTSDPADYEDVQVAVSDEMLERFLVDIARYHGGIDLATGPEYGTFLHYAPTTTKDGRTYPRRSRVQPLTSFDPEMSPRWMGFKYDGRYCMLMVLSLPEQRYAIFTYVTGTAGLTKIAEGVSDRTVPSALLLCEEMLVDENTVYHEEDGTVLKDVGETYYYVHDASRIMVNRAPNIITAARHIRRHYLTMYMDEYMRPVADLDEGLMYVRTVGDDIDMRATRYVLGDIAFERRRFILVDTLDGGPPAAITQMHELSEAASTETDGIVVGDVGWNMEKDKPVSKITVDLVFKNGMWHYSRRGVLVAWKIPKRIKPLGASNVPAEDMVYEIALDPTKKNKRHFKMRIVRARPDKGGTPNGGRTVKSNVDAVLNQKTVGSIFGMTPHRVFSIMRAVMSYMNNTVNKGKKVFIEIGAGRGGNVHSYPNGSKVLFIEFSPDYDELVFRTKRANQYARGGTKFYTLRAKYVWDADDDAWDSPLNLFTVREGLRAATAGVDHEIWQTFFDIESDTYVRPIVNLYNVMTFVPPTEYPVFLDGLRTFIVPRGINVVDFSRQGIEAALGRGDEWRELGMTITRSDRVMTDEGVPLQRYGWTFPQDTVVGSSGDQPNGYVGDVKDYLSDEIVHMRMTRGTPFTIQTAIEQMNRTKNISQWNELSDAEQTWLNMQLVQTFVSIAE